MSTKCEFVDFIVANKNGHSKIYVILRTYRIRYEMEMDYKEDLEKVKGRNTKGKYVVAKGKNTDRISNIPFDQEDGVER